MASLGIGISTVVAIELATDAVLRKFFQDLVSQGGAAKDVEDFIMHKPQFPIPITMACSLINGNKINLRYTQMEERDVVRDSSFIAAIWRLVGTEIRNRRRSDDREIALINAVYVMAAHHIEHVLDLHQVVEMDKHLPLAQTRLVGTSCGFEPVATIEFTSCLRHASHFTPTARDMNTAVPWQFPV